MGPVNIILAYSLDLALGDPRWFPHPVRIMGKAVDFLERILRNGQKKMLRIKGSFLALIVVGFSGVSTYLILTAAEKINPIVGKAAWIFLAYTSLAAKDLFLHVKAVIKKLEDKNIIGAREELSHIVGRDTEHLEGDDIIKASIETVAESTNDGIIAPLFYLILGGPVAAISYKAVNTLDSMVGHKDEKYRDFGWFSARLDDAANFIPSRITGILISLSAFLAGKGFSPSFKTMLRDGKKHPSPNSGIPEAAMAGALRVRLGGASMYEGELIHKPYLGEAGGQVNVSLITEAVRISFITSFIMVMIGAALKWLL